MNGIISELILRDFYFAEAVFGKYFEGASFLRAQCDNYYIDASEAEVLFSAANSLADIKTVSDYYRYLRVRQFRAMTHGGAGETDAALSDLISIKGGALELAERYKVGANELETVTSIYNKLNAPYNVNIIPLIRVTGIMLCEGIFFNKNVALGIKNLKKAARWNDVASLMPLIRYDEKDRANDINLLYTLADGTLYGELAGQVCERYHVKRTRYIEECHILDKVFQEDKLKCDIYASQYADILYSKTLGKHDREKLLLNSDKNITGRLKNLPVNLSAEHPLVYDGSAFDNMPITRRDEVTMVTSALNNADLRVNDSYRPLCLYSESKYVLSAYLNAFKEAFVGAKVEHIVVADLSAEDVINSDSNVFVRSCNDKKANVYLIELSGKINSKVAELVIGFLASARRRRFHINEMDVTIDLSPILPVCFCDKSNYRLLKDYCEVLELVRLDKNEQEAAVINLINEKTISYGLASLEFGRETSERFGTMDIDAVEKVMDRAVRSYRVSGKPVVISDEMMNDFWKYGETETFGFGRKAV